MEQISIILLAVYVVYWFYRLVMALINSMK